MKKYSILMMLFASLLIYGCSKKEVNPVVPPPVPTFTVKSVSLPTFASSSWANINGGNVLAQFDKLDASGIVVSSTTDSVAYSSLATYSKTLGSGTYNVTLSSTSKSVADTFIRFKAIAKALSITDKEAATFTTTTTDGLITIGKSFVKDGTIPTFKPDSGAISHNFGLANGFYFLYVKGGTDGTLNFTAQSNGQTETLSKHISIVALAQDNVALQTNNGSIQIVFVPFVYNQVQASSSTLLTLNVDPNSYEEAAGTVYFVATDANGNVLSSVKYLPGTTMFKMSASQPYEQDRFNFFEVFIPTEANVVPDIVGYLQVRKGSLYLTNPPSLPVKPTPTLNLQYQNVSNFDQLSVSADFSALSVTSSANISTLSSLFGSAGSPIWVQMLKNNQYFYNFFNVPSGATSLNVDLNQLTKTPNLVNITCPGNTMQVSVWARADTNYANFYQFGGVSSPGNQLTYYYPTEKFEQYYTSIYYQLGNLNYFVGTADTKVATQATSLNATFNIPTTNLATFTPSISGTYDYYQATFSILNKLQVTLLCPSTANYSNIKLPDFSTYLGLSSLDLSTLALKNFGLYQVAGFKETNLFYLNYSNYSNRKYILENF